MLLLFIGKLIKEPYEVLDSTGQPGPQTSRLTRKSSPLFKDFRFLCAPPLKSVSKSDLEVLYSVQIFEFV